MRSLRTVLSAPLCVCLMVAGGAAQSITTTFAANGGIPPGGCMLFDAELTCDLTIEAFDVNTSAAVGSPVSIDIWVTPGTYVGNETNVGVWTKVASGTGSSAGLNNPTSIDTTDFTLTAGSYGVNVVYTDAAGMRTAGNGSNQSYSNPEISLELGAVMTECFDGSVFIPRVWNGTIYYAPSESFPAYCTAKTNSCGTLPQITSSGAPSASASAGFVIACERARAQKSGLLLYTDAGPGAVPFQGGWLCLQAPLRRVVPVADSSGTPSQCDGRLEVDLNAFARGLLGGNPAAFLDQPGVLVHAQWWGRDTLAAGSLLSDGRAFSLCP